MDTWQVGYGVASKELFQSHPAPNAIWEGMNPPWKTGKFGHQQNHQQATSMNSREYSKILTYKGFLFIYLVGGLEHEWIIFHFIYGMSSFPLTFIFFKMVKTTNQICILYKLIVFPYHLNPAENAQELCVGRPFGHWKLCWASSTHQCWIGCGGVLGEKLCRPSCGNLHWENLYSLYSVYIYTYIHTWHDITWHYIPLHYITLHYMPLHTITLHYITYIDR